MKKELSKGCNQMVSLSVAANRLLAVVMPLLAVAPSSFGATSEGKEIIREEDKKLLQEVVLPQNPDRSPVEQYYGRTVFHMKEGQTLIAAYWRQGGSFLAEAVDIFAIQKAPKKVKVRKVYSGVLGGTVNSIVKIDFDRDNLEDLILLHDTGGMILTKGVTALHQTPTGFSEVFSYQGHDIWVYREGGQVRIMVKAKSLHSIQEFGWDPAKHTFEVKRTVELLD